MIVPDEDTQEIDYKFQLAFRFCVTVIMMLPALFDFDEYALIVINGAAVAPFITFVYPLMCYNCYYAKHKRKRNIVVFNYILLVFAIATNFWSVYDEITKDK